jgi:hypothetical protein
MSCVVVVILRSWGGREERGQGERCSECINNLVYGNKSKWFLTFKTLLVCPCLFCHQVKIGVFSSKLLHCHKNEEIHLVIVHKLHVFLPYFAMYAYRGKKKVKARIAGLVHQRLK